MASPDRALPLKRDAAHIPVNAVAAQAEGDCQLFAAQQFAILHIGALQNIDPVMPAVGFPFRELETRLPVEHRADHPVEDLKEKGRRNGSFVAACRRFRSGPTPILTYSSIKTMASSREIYRIIYR